MDNLTLELLTEFDNSNLFHAYDIHTLKLKLIIEAENNIFKNINFHITVRDYYHFEELEEKEVEQYLLGPNAKSLQHLIEQCSFPLEVKEKAELVVMVELDIPGPLIDILKNMQDYLLNPKYSLYPETFELFINCIITDINGNPLASRIIEEIKNPWYEK